MSNYVEAAKHNMVVVIIQYCRLNVNRVENSLANSFYVTKLINDQTISEVSDFKDSFSSQDDSSSQVNSQISSSSSQNTLDSDVVSNVKNVEVMLAIKEKTSIWIVAKITAALSRSTWCYLGCAKKNCRAKLTPQGNGYFCKKCGQTYPNGVHKYLLRITIEERKKCATLTMWDREAFYFIRKTVVELAAAISCYFTYLKPAI